MRIVVTGASGQLGAYVLGRLRDDGASATAWSGARAGALFGFPLRPVPLGDRDAVAEAFRDARPDVVIHAAAVTKVAECHRDPALARQINGEESALLAELCAESGARLVYVSTDMVFNGEKGNYREGDAPSPLSVYGRSKAEAEPAVLHCPNSAVVRVSLLYGPPINGRPSFFSEQLTALCEGRPIRLFEDEWRTPLDLGSAARGLLTVARSDYRGLLHLGGPERMSRLEMGRRVAAALGLDAAAIVAAKRGDTEGAEPRPRDTSLDSSSLGSLFPHFARPGLERAVRGLPGG